MRSGGGSWRAPTSCWMVALPSRCTASKIWRSSWSGGTNGQPWTALLALLPAFEVAGDVGHAVAYGRALAARGPRRPSARSVRAVPPRALENQGKGSPPAESGHRRPARLRRSTRTAARCSAAAWTACGGGRSGCPAEDRRSAPSPWAGLSRTRSRTSRSRRSLPWRGGSPAERLRRARWRCEWSPSRPAGVAAGGHPRTESVERKPQHRGLPSNPSGVAQDDTSLGVIV